MHMTRRSLFKGVAASVAVPRLGWATPGKELLEARPASVQILPDDYPASDLWLFGETTPGP